MTATPRDALSGLSAQADSPITVLDIDDIRTKGGTQIRVMRNDTVAEAYRDAVDEGAEFPPVVVFFDGAEYWLADGFHRLFAHAAANRTEILAEVRPGSLRDAILYAVGANALHGLHRTPGDKRNAVMTLLKDPEWSEWPPKRIADQCCVSERLVWKVKAENPHLLHGAGDTRAVERGGTTYSMNVANLRREPAPAPEWRQTDIEEFTGSGGDEYEPDDGQRCTNCAHCVWRDAFDGYECTVFHKQTYHDAIIGFTCPAWEPGPDPEAAPEPVFVPRFPPEHAAPAERIRWLVEQLHAALTLTPAQAAAASPVRPDRYGHHAAHVAQWLDDLLTELETKENAA